MDESHAQRQADPFSMANTSPPEDPFADLVDPSFSSAPQRASGAAPVTSADQTVALHRYATCCPSASLLLIFLYVAQFFERTVRHHVDLQLLIAFDGVVSS